MTLLRLLSITATGTGTVSVERQEPAIERTSFIITAMMLLPGGSWLGAVFTAAAAAAISSSVVRFNTNSSSAAVVERPAFVRNALEQPDTEMYYFGIGSNMLRSKIENRGVNGSTIELIHMEPAVVVNHRLSFRMRGFVPLEPGMGSLEPVEYPGDETVGRKDQNRYAYSRPECHGALVTLTPENYEKVMRSEGVGGPNSTNPGYEEIIVTAIPYDTRKPPVQAVALRARRHVRLHYDPCPSPRYLSLLRQGASELSLVPEYQTFLERHPVQQSPAWLKSMAIQNLIANLALSTRIKWRGFSRAQSWFLSGVYVPSAAPLWQQRLSNLAMGCILCPGACAGILYQTILQRTGRELSPMLQRFVGLMKNTNSTGTDNASSDTRTVQTNKVVVQT